MSGNELGDRVHNFFAQDNSLQVQDQLKVQEGNWPVLNSNFWVRNQRQIDLLKSSSKSYPSQNSDRGQASYPVHGSHGLHFSQSNLRPDISKGQFINEQQYPSGVVNGNQLYQNWQNEANSLAVDMDSNQRHPLSSRGLSIQDAQQRMGHELQEKASDRPEISMASASFDLFGGQPQKNHQQASKLHALQRQQSGLNDMQKLPQQIMIRKMHEFQMQQQLNELDLRPQNPVSQAPSFNRQTSGSQSSNMVNHILNSDALQYPWTAEPGTSWLSHGSTAMQGSPSTPVFPPNLAHTQQLMDLAPQQADQSLYGVPVSSSRGLAVNQYSQMMTDKYSMPQMDTFSNSLHGSQHTTLPDHIGRQEGTSISGPKSYNENHGLASSQSVNIGRTDRGALQPVNLMQRNAPQQYFSGRQELATQSDTSHEKSTRQVSTTSPNEVALDPAEEKILFGSDDNIWSDFVKIPNLSGEATNLFDNDGLSDGFPSIQSGRWSALMQSAVAETSSNDIGQREERSGSKLERNDWNALGVVPPDGDQVLSNHEAELLHKSQNNRLMVMQGGVHRNSLWKSDSVTSSTIEAGPVKVGNHLADKCLLSLNDASAPVANSCNTRVGNETNSYVQNNNLLNQWTSAHPSDRYQGIEGWRGMQDQVNEPNQGLDLFNRGGKDEVRRHDTESCAIKENSHDSHRSNLSQHASGGFKEVGLSNTSNSRSLPPRKQKLTNQLASKVSVPNKFQHHPLGNLDEEPTFGMEQPTQVLPSSLQNTHFGHSSQVSQYSAVTDKGELPKENKGTNEEPSHGSFPGCSPRMYFPFNQPLDPYAPNKASSPSQNMLELLNKVDQSRNDGVVTHLSSEGNVSSQPPEAEKSDGSAGHTQNGKSFGYKGFGLQLGPPSQRLQITDLSLPSQNVRDAANSIHTTHAGSEMLEKTLQTSSVQSFPFPNAGSLLGNDRSAGPGHLRDEKSLYKVPGNYHLAHGSNTQYSRSQLQNKQIARGSGKMAMDEQIDSSFSCNVSHSTQRGYVETVLPDASRNIQKDNLASCEDLGGTSYTQEKGPSATQSTRDQICTTQNFGVPIILQGASRQVLQNMWNNIPSSQHPLAAQYPKSPSNLSSQALPNIVESSPHSDLHDNREGNLSSELSAVHANSRGVVDEDEHRLKDSCSQITSFVNIDSTSKAEEFLYKESSIKDNLEDSPANSASTQKGIEAFGQSLQPNAFSNKNYALLNEMRALKDEPPDPSIRVSKSIKGSDNIFDDRHVHVKAGQQNEDNVGDMMASSSGVPPEDSRMFSFSSSSGTMQRNTYLHGNIASQGIVLAGLDASQINPSSDCTTSVRVENHQVISQMEPSWFNQYGPLKNGQMPIYNAHKVTSLRTNEPSSTLGRFSSIWDALSLEKNITADPIGACQVDITLKSAPTSVSHEHFSSAQSLQLDVSAQRQVILRPKKRKSTTTELDPWHREISDRSQNILVLSEAEGDWNKAANHLNEKIQDDSELIEDGSPLLRSKRRLTLTTQLMQQLFRPPPATILSADASSTYGSVTYAVSRVALGDACCVVNCSSDLGPRDCLDLHSMTGKLNDDPRFAKVVKEFLGNSRKLEDDLLRLDKSASILELSVEFQDLERFSVINRFAKFHGRGQTDNFDVSSTDATGTTLRRCVQRYAAAVPMSKNLPDRVQCLSL